MLERVSKGPQRISNAVLVGHPPRYERLPGGQAPRLPPPLRCGHRLSRRRHRRRLAAESRLVLAADPTTTSCRSCCARPARAPGCRYIPGNHDEFLRDYYGTAFRRHRSRRGGHPRRRRRQALPGDPWRPVRRGHPSCALARAAGRHRLRAGDLAQHPFQRAAPRARADLLVAFAMGQAEGEERGQLHRRISRTRSPTRRSGAASTA